MVSACGSMRTGARRARSLHPPACPFAAARPTRPARGGVHARPPRAPGGSRPSETALHPGQRRWHRTAGAERGRSPRRRGGSAAAAAHMTQARRPHQTPPPFAPAPAPRAPARPAVILGTCTPASQCRCCRCGHGGRRGRGGAPLGAALAAAPSRQGGSSQRTPGRPRPRSGPAPPRRARRRPRAARGRPPARARGAAAPTAQSQAHARPALTLQPSNHHH